MNSECGVNAIILLDSKDMAFGAKTVLRTRCNQEEKTRTADYANYEFTRGLIKDYNEIGNPVEAEVLKCYTQTFMEQNQQMLLLNTSKITKKTEINTKQH